VDEPTAPADTHAAHEPADLLASRLRALPPGTWTRYAPAPTGYLHLGHVANALYVWGVARAIDGRVLLRIEDHDRGRCRPAYDAALLRDLAGLGLEPDAGPVRQSDAAEPYLAALERLRTAGRVYGCDCTRSTFAAWADASGRAWTGPGCPGRCRERAIGEGPGRATRVALDAGREAWDDLALGPLDGPVAATGDPPARDRHGNWTYGFAVVVDDLRHGIDLVIRGADLVEVTPDQIRLGRLLGRPAAPRFLHHPLIRKAGGAKLSKADRDEAIGERLSAGATPASLFGEAGFLVGLLPSSGPVTLDEVAARFR
jgi:glutamyl/glutaminyl-tRNA synthetase